MPCRMGIHPLEISHYLFQHPARNYCFCLFQVLLRVEKPVIGLGAALMAGRAPRPECCPIGPGSRSS
jgi:hypothetical protein